MSYRSLGKTMIEMPRTHPAVVMSDEYYIAKAALLGAYFRRHSSGANGGQVWEWLSSHPSLLVTDTNVLTHRGDTGYSFESADWFWSTGAAARHYLATIGEYDV